MKTMVLGLFDRIEDAERVLEQLSGAPLDLDAVQVLHRDTALQRRLSEQAGIEPRRSLRTGMVFGGLLGAALGFAASWGGAGSEPLLSGPGPLLSLAAGCLLGALLGALGGALSESGPIPDRHAEVTLEALRQGATMVSVRTASQPTARAIADLFRVGGSRQLDEPARAEGDPATASDALVPSADSGATPGGSSAEMSSDLPDTHAPFAPPWRREPGAAAPSHGEAGSAEPEAEARADIRHGQTVTSVDRSSREVQPRDVPAPPPPVPDPASETGAEPAADATPSKASRESARSVADRSENVPGSDLGGSREAKAAPRQASAAAEARDPRLESVARAADELLRELFGGPDG